MTVNALYSVLSVMESLVVITKGLGDANGIHSYYIIFLAVDLIFRYTIH